MCRGRLSAGTSKSWSPCARTACSCGFVANEAIGVLKPCLPLIREGHSLGHFRKNCPTDGVFNPPPRLPDTRDSECIGIKFRSALKLSGQTQSPLWGRMHLTVVPFGKSGLTATRQQTSRGGQVTAPCFFRSGPALASNAYFRAGLVDFSTPVLLFSKSCYAKRIVCKFGCRNDQIDLIGGVLVGQYPAKQAFGDSGASGDRSNTERPQFPDGPRILQNGSY